MIFSIGRPQYFISHNTHNMNLGCLWYAPLWKKLPSALRMETSLKPFKAKLKTLLFKEAYDL